MPLLVEAHGEPLHRLEQRRQHEPDRPRSDDVHSFPRKARARRWNRTAGAFASLVEPPFPSSRIYQRPSRRPGRVRLPPMGVDAGRGLEVTGSPLVVTRPQILAFRRRAGALDQRLPPGRRSLRQAAWAGLQDSMPRAAVLSIHARVEGAGPSSWEDPSFVQLWGPRYQVYVVAERDLPAFSLGRLPDDAKGRGRAEETAAASARPSRRQEDGLRRGRARRSASTPTR